MDDNTIYIYNARYPDSYKRRHIIFDKFTFNYEWNTSNTRNGLPGLCNLYLYPVIPCRVPNAVVPIRSCQNIGKFEFATWPQVIYDFAAYEYVSFGDMTSMLGTSFITCSTIENDTNGNDKSTIAFFKTPLVPNMRVKDGFDAFSNTACLKLNFNGVVEPIWLGNVEGREQNDVYLERLPGIPF